MCGTEITAMRCYASQSKCRAEVNLLVCMPHRAQFYVKWVGKTFYYNSYVYVLFFFLCKDISGKCLHFLNCPFTKMMMNKFKF